MGLVAVFLRGGADNAAVDNDTGHALQGGWNTVQRCCGDYVARIYGLEWIEYRDAHRHRTDCERIAEGEAGTDRERGDAGRLHRALQQRRKGTVHRDVERSGERE